MPKPGSGIVLTPQRAWCSGHDAANRRARKGCRPEWSDEDWNEAVRVQARLLRHLGPPYDAIAADMMGDAR